MSKAAHRSSKMRTGDLEAALVSLTSPTIVLVKQPIALIEHNSLKCFCSEWKKERRCVFF